MLRQRSYTNDERLQYRFNNGIPNQLTMSPGDYNSVARVTTTALYVQEQYTRGRLTLQGALRYDRAGSYSLPQQVGPDRFVPVALEFPRTEGVKGFNDINPRMGVAYNVFGNGKTALKANVGRYVEAASHNNRYSATNPLNRIATSTTRSWTDGNRNYVADCDLLNPAAQDFRARGGDSVRGVLGQHLRDDDVQQHVRPGHPRGQPAERLGPGRFGPAGGAAARLGGGGLLPSVVEQLPGDGQPGRGAIRLRSVLVRCAGGSAVA